jgi:hypothetical protein
VIGPRILRYVLQWGLAHRQTWTIARAPSPAKNISVRVTQALRQQVQDAALAARVPVSTWLRHVVQHVTTADVQASWPPGATLEDRSEDMARRALQSHDSRTYARHFMIGVDEATGQKLAALMQAFERSAAEIIHHLITQATPEDFPKSWRRTGEERQGDSRG